MNEEEIYELLGEVAYWCDKLREDSSALSGVCNLEVDWEGESSAWVTKVDSGKYRVSIVGLWYVGVYRCPPLPEADTLVGLSGLEEWLRRKEELILLNAFLQDVSGSGKTEYEILSWLREAFPLIEEHKNEYGSQR